MSDQQSRATSRQAKLEINQLGAASAIALALIFLAPAKSVEDAEASGEGQVVAVASSSESSQPVTAALSAQLISQPPPQTCREVIGASMRRQGSIHHADPQLVSLIESYLSTTSAGAELVPSEIQEQDALRSVEPFAPARQRLAFSVKQAVADSATDSLCLASSQASALTKPPN